jgi:serine protease
MRKSDTSEKAGRALSVRAVSFTLALMAGFASASLMAQSSGNQTINPYSPATDHSYRRGVIPTKDAHDKMESWRRTNAASTAASTSNTLSYGGSIDGIGVTSGTPKVYIVVYGTQWGTASTDVNGNMTLSNDKVGAVPYIESLFKHIGTGGELWSGTMTQYCDGSTVAKGATSCPPNASHVGYPNGGPFAGIWYDNTTASPTQATKTQLAQEAINAAAHFGNTTPASNRYAQYIIMSPSGTHPDGFNTVFGQFCAWHDYTGDSQMGVSSPYGDIAFTNLPYVYDAGQNCATGSVNSGAQGSLDGFSIGGGHEYAETITDQNPPGGWTSSASGEENADECAWITSGQGAMQNVTMGSAAFAMQSTWSNDTNQCEISHPIIGDDGGTTTTTSGGTTTTTAVATTTTTTATTTTTTMPTSCYTASNPTHVAAGRATDIFGFAYAKGSYQYMGFDNAYFVTSLKQVGSSYYVVPNCN